MEGVVVVVRTAVLMWVVVVVVVGGAVVMWGSGRRCSEGGWGGIEHFIFECVYYVTIINYL